MTPQAMQKTRAATSESSTPTADRRSRLGWLLLLVPFWLLVCWYGTQQHFAAMERDAIRNQIPQAQRQLEDISGNIGQIVALRRGVPATLARDSDIRATLKRFGSQMPAATQSKAERRQRWEADPSLAAIGRTLSLVSRDLSVSVLYLMNAGGDCIASSNAGQTDSFVGANFQDRAYFQTASQGQAGQQFAVGMVSKVAGLYFSAPVMDNGRFLGAVVTKIDLNTLAPWIRQADTLLSDDYGTIVLARDQALEMHHLPNAKVGQLDDQARRNRYQRHEIPEIPLGRDADRPEFWRLPGRDAPLLLESMSVPDQHLAVTVIWPLPQIAAIHTEHWRTFQRLSFLGLIVLGGLALLRAHLRQLARIKQEKKTVELRFRTLFQGLSDAVFINHLNPLTGRPSGHFLEVNDAACRLLGYEHARLLHLGMADILDTGKADQDSRQNIPSLQRETLRAADGREIPVELTTRLMRLGPHDLALSIVRDISIRTRIEETLAKAQAHARLITETMAEGFWIIGPGNKTQDVNPALCALLGHSRETLLGKNPLEFTDPDHQAHLEALLSYGGGTPHRGEELSLLHQSGARIPVTLDVVARSDGEVEAAHTRFLFITDQGEKRRLEQAQKETAEILSQAQAIAHLGSWRLDLTSKQLTWSEETHRIFGLTDYPQLDDQVWSRFLNPGDLAKRHQTLADVGLGLPYDLIFPIQIQGKTKWLREWVEQSLGPDGQPVAYIGTLQDITLAQHYAQELEFNRDHLEELVAQRTAQLRAAETRYRSVVECASDGFWSISEDLCLREVNDAYVRRSGFSREELLSMRIPDLDSAQDEPAVSEIMRHLTQVGSLCFETSHRTKDGHCWPVEVSVSYWHEGRLAFAFMRDITERKALEAARETARREAEKLAKAKSEFLANMSHEIRTPLNGVLGLAQVGYRESGGRKTRSTFSHILESGKLLLGVVNDILDFSKIEAGCMTVERIPVDLHRLLQGTVALHTERARIKNLSLHLEQPDNLPSTILGDPLRLGQVLGNLLSNAIKFTDKGGITLQAEPCTDADGQQRLLLTVVDTGIGMTAEQLTRLFTPFEQADGSTTRRFGGTGLGLAISQAMVQLMGGHIEVSSQPGQGSRFQVNLPLTLTQAITRVSHAVAEPRSHSKRLTGLTLLAAEDNDINRMVLEDMLKAEGAQVTLVGNGRLAVDQILAHGPDYFDIVLMDIQMPEMDGLEASQRIRELAPRLPIIAQTAHALKEEKERSLAAGMVDHVTKPLDLEELVHTLLQYAR